MLNISVMAETYPEFTEQYRAQILRHANNTLTNEEGCLGFIVHMHETDPNRFFIYETYRSRKDFEEVHKVAPYLAEHAKLTASWVKSKEILLWNSISPER